MPNDIPPNRQYTAATWTGSSSHSLPQLGNIPHTVQASRHITARPIVRNHMLHRSSLHPIRQFRPLLLSSSFSRIHTLYTLETHRKEDSRRNKAIRAMLLQSAEQKFVLYARHCAKMGGQQEKQLRGGRTPNSPTRSGTEHRRKWRVGTIGGATWERHLQDKGAAPPGKCGLLGEMYRCKEKTRH